MLTSLGIAHLRQGLLTEASRLLVDALAMARDLDSLQCQADALTALGEVAELTSDRDTARASFTQARELYSQVDDRRAVDVAERLTRLNTSTP